MSEGTIKRRIRDPEQATGYDNIMRLAVHGDRVKASFPNMERLRNRRAHPCSGKPKIGRPPFRI